jgi:hypothetical protein
MNSSNARVTAAFFVRFTADFDSLLDELRVERKIGSRVSPLTHYGLLAGFGVSHHRIAQHGRQPSGSPGYPETAG